jgi:hypothetical protein
MTSTLRSGGHVAIAVGVVRLHVRLMWIDTYRTTVVAFCEVDTNLKIDCRCIS